jgi:AcrR family transcriptional regulator
MGNGDATKTALLEAAKQLIRERGYAGTSVRDLAAASGTNLAAVNYHFGSREKLLNRAVLESFMEWTYSIGQVSSRLTSTDPNAGPLEHMAAQARPTLAELPERLPLFVMGLEALLQAQRSPELLSQLTAHYAEQRRQASEFIIAATQGRYEPAPDDEPPPRMVEVAASFMLAVVDGLMLQALLDPEAIPTGEELAMFYEGLAAITRATGPASTG